MGTVSLAVSWVGWLLVGVVGGQLGLTGGVLVTFSGAPPRTTPKTLALGKTKPTNSSISLKTGGEGVDIPSCTSVGSQLGSVGSGQLTPNQPQPTPTDRELIAN